jgi:hypothetical protein
VDPATGMVGTVIIPASDFVKLLQSQTRQQGSQKPISADSSSRTQINSNSRVAKDDRDTSKGNDPSDGGIINTEATKDPNEVLLPPSEHPAVGSDKSHLLPNVTPGLSRSHSLGALRVVQFIHSQGKFSDDEKNALITDIISGQGNVVKAYMQCDMHNYVDNILRDDQADDDNRKSSNILFDQFAEDAEDDAESEDTVTDDTEHHVADEDDEQDTNTRKPFFHLNLTPERADTVLSEFEDMCRALITQTQTHAHPHPT